MNVEIKADEVIQANLDLEQKFDEKNVDLGYVDTAFAKLMKRKVRKVTQNLSDLTSDF